MAELKITSDNFQKEVMESTKPVLLDFWAAWCGPCKMQGPVFEEAAEKLQDRAVFGKVNVDEQPHLAQQFGVMSIPTIVLLQNGQVVAKEVGVHSLEELEKMIP